MQDLPGGGDFGRARGVVGDAETVSPMGSFYAMATVRQSLVDDTTTYGRAWAVICPG